MLTGRLVAMFEPIPNWPALLSPMPHKVPSAFTNSEWVSPAEAAITLVAMLTGGLVMVFAPLPNCP